MQDQGRALAVVLGGLVTISAAQAHAAFVFTDKFKPPSALWNDASGSWTASKGDYYAQHPNNNPEALSSLPYVFGNVNDTFTVKVNDLGDGGIYLKSSTSSDYVLLVLGGAGYGQGQRGPGRGTSAYWADAANPGALFDDDASAFTPGSSYTLKLTVKKGVFTAYEHVGKSYVDITSFTYPSLTSFTFGLYDDQPNTTTASGFGPAQSFSSLRLTSSTAVTGGVGPFGPAPGVPEPSTWAVMMLGLGATGAALRARRRLSGRAPVAPGR